MDLEKYWDGQASCLSVSNEPDPECGACRDALFAMSVAVYDSQIADKTFCFDRERKMPHYSLCIII